jgi:hypothetical protein
VKEGRIIRGDRERPGVIVSASDDTDVRSKGRCKQVEPLADKIEGGRHHQRAALLVFYREDGDEALAGTGGKHHDTPTAAGAPRRQSLALVRARCAVGLGARGKVRICPGFVLIRRLGSDERPHNFGVRGGGSAIALGARIPGAAGGPRSILWPLANLERAGDELKADHGCP